MVKKKKHPQGVEQFADSTNTQANDTPQEHYIPLDGQLSLFDAPPLKIRNKLRLIELFSGIGAQAKAMERLGVDWESWGAYDIDPYAVKAYNAIHGTNYEPSDICKLHASDLNIVDRDKYTYLLFYSFPCQDLSLAGNGKGMKKGSGTRSGLLWEVERLLHECGENLPQILVMENVEQVISKKNKPDFDMWRESLRDMGFESECRVLNAKDYGVAQNRERCFMVSWLGDYTYEFPKPIPLTKRLRDYLESEVDEKFFLTDEQVSTFVAKTEEHKAKGNGFAFEPIDAYGEADTRTAKTILAKQRDWLTGTYIRTGGGSSERIRKLTLRECWRLMDFDDEDFNKAQAIESNTQLYAQAGNSIVVNCLVAIFGQMFDGKEEVYKERNNGIDF